jgi:hypothetical protein
MTVSKRVKRFKDDLIGEIPRFPNNRDSLRAMQSKNLTDVLIAYINWRIRFVGVRPRTTSIAHEAVSDSRWATWEPQVNKLLTKVGAGEDITPHLSLAPRSQGYTPASSAPNATIEERWSDKDLVLNAMGYHHLHLGDVTPPLAHADRTNELVFARITRDALEVVAIFGHEVFESGTPERLRLFALHQDRLLSTSSPGSAVLLSSMTLSGTTMIGTLKAQELIRLINQIDPLLDDPSRRGELSSLGINAIKPEKLRWFARHLDFGLYDKEGNTFSLLLKGPT